MSLATNLSISLRNRRESLGLSQKKLGETIKFSRQAIIDWESGKAPVPLDVIEPLAIALKWTVAGMLGIEEVPGHSLDECVRRVSEAALSKQPTPAIPRPRVPLIEALTQCSDEEFSQTVAALRAILKGRRLILDNAPEPSKPIE